MYLLGSHPVFIPMKQTECLIKEKRFSEALCLKLLHSPFEKGFATYGIKTAGPRSGKIKTFTLVFQKEVEKHVPSI